MPARIFDIREVRSGIWVSVGVGRAIRPTPEDIIRRIEIGIATAVKAGSRGVDLSELRKEGPLRERVRAALEKGPKTGIKFPKCLGWNFRIETRAQEVERREAKKRNRPERELPYDRRFVIPGGGLGATFACDDERDKRGVAEYVTTPKGGIIPMQQDIRFFKFPLTARNHNRIVINVLLGPQ